MTMNSNSSTETKWELRKAANKEEMNQQFIVFALTIVLTILAFAAVVFADVINMWFVAPFIMVLAIVQVMFQLFYFMHMSHKGHEAPIMFIFTAILLAAVTVIALMTIVWW
ncbi:MAG TPA: cytochrome c oxidase subunit IVB [Bacillus bacterium]|nr:cytochrome c oxidase subunit IVB [Bacillus sp. (in: firmicutes)]